MKEKQTFIILLAILVLGISLWYGFLYSPAQRKIDKSATELDQILEKVKAARKAKVDLKNIETRFDMVQQKLENEKNRFIRRDELSRVTTDMNELARRYQLRLTDFAPALDNYFAENREAQIVELPLVITIRGSYINMGKYIENWHQLPFYITGDALEISVPKKGSKDLEAKISAKLYTWNE